MKRGGPIRRYKRIDQKRIARAATDKHRYKPRPGLAQARRFAAGRANGKCEVRAPGCFVRGTQAHHILMRSQGGEDDPANLLWCCSNCHGYVHANPAVSYEHGWLKRRTAG